MIPPCGINYNYTVISHFADEGHLNCKEYENPEFSHVVVRVHVSTGGLSRS